ncbi:MAG: asparagine synthase C-terminal domain-containing protein, partial [Patescibacteria group bacterium]|nr:asparagine synthase C-terminal domain-containing protein [Patescibacteria group bacterium]
IMPKEFVYRRKQGFGAPVKEWLKTETMKKFVLHTLGNNASIYKFLKKDVALSMINAFYQKGDDKMYYKIWSLLCLELWLKSHEKYHRPTA